MKTVGDRIRLLRQNNNMSQKQVADIVGVQRPNYSKIENNKQNLTAEQIIKLCEFFNVSADYVLGIIVDKKKVITKHEYDYIQDALLKIKETLE